MSRCALWTRTHSAGMSTVFFGRRGRSVAPRRMPRTLFRRRSRACSQEPRAIRGDERWYLTKALRNTFLNSRRTASRRPAVSASLEDVVPVDANTRTRPEHALEAQEAVRGDSHAARGLQARAGGTIDMLGLSYREAAKALGVREATVTTRLYRARNAVAKELGGESRLQAPRRIGRRSAKYRPRVTRDRPQVPAAQPQAREDPPRREGSAADRCQRRRGQTRDSGDRREGENHMNADHEAVDDRTARELASLADGSLSPGRAQRLLAACGAGADTGREAGGPAPCRSSWSRPSPAEPAPA